MGQVQTTFTGDSNKLLAEYNKLLQASTRQQQKLKDLGQQSKKQHDEVKGQISGQVRSLTTMAASYLSIQKGIGFVTEAYRDWRAEMKGVGDEQQRINRELVKQVALAGELGQLPAIESILKQAPGVTRTQAVAAFGGVAEGGPEVANKIGFAVAAAKAAPLGVDLAEFGEFVGQIASFDPNIAPEAAADLGLTIQSQLGKHFSRFKSARAFGPVRGLVDSGALTRDQAIAFAMEAVRADEPRMAGLLFEGATTEFTAPKKRPRAMTEERFSALQALAAAETPAERAQLLLTDEEAARAAISKEQAGKFLNFIQSDKHLQARQSLEQSLGGASGAVGRGIVGLGASEAGREVALEQGLAAALEKSQGKLDERQKRTELAEQILSIWLNEQEAGFFSRGVIRSAFAINQKKVDLFGSDPGEALDDALTKRAYNLGVQFREQGGNPEQVLQEILAELRHGNQSGRSPAAVPDIREK